MRQITISDEVEDALAHLATEDEVPVEVFLQQLVEREDRQRHLGKVPYQPDLRTKCVRKLCAEEQPVPVFDEG